MEIIHDSEIELSDGCFDIPITNGCIDDDVPLGAVTSYKSGVFKSFKDIIYNQLEIDPYSCFVVGNYTAMSNLTGKTIPYSVMKKTLNRLQSDGKFRPGFGGGLKDGANYAMQDFNKFSGTNLKLNQDSLTVQSIIESIESGSPVSTGIKYGANFLKNEQDDGIIQNISGTTGNKGHCITIVKINTTDPTLGAQIKYVENYNGVLKYNIIYVNFEQLRSLFFNSCISYHV